MHAMWLAAVAAATVGVDVGWQPVEDGGMEYIIQLEPHQAQSLKSGDVIEVGVRPELRDVRRYRIVVGDSALPRQANSPGLTAKDSPKKTVTAMDPVTNNAPGRSVVVQPRLAPTISIPTTPIPTTPIPTTPIPTTPIPTTPIPTAAIPSADVAELADNRFGDSPRVRFPSSDTVAARPTLTIADPNSVPAGNPGLTDAGRNSNWSNSPAERAGYDEAKEAASPENASRSTPRFELPAKGMPQYRPGDSVPLKPLDEAATRLTETTLPDALENAAGAITGRSALTPPSPPQNAFSEDRVPNRYPQDQPAGAQYDWPKAPAEEPAVAASTPKLPNEGTSRYVPADPTGRYESPAVVAVQPQRANTVERPAAMDVNPRVVPAVDQRNSRYSSQSPPQPGTTFVAAASPAGTAVDHDHQAHKPNAQQTTPASNQPVSQNTTGQAAATEPVEPADRPWFPLTLTLFALFASIGGNLYLGWITWDIRLRFRELLFRTRRDGEGPRVNDLDDEYDSHRDI